MRRRRQGRLERADSVAPTQRARAAGPPQILAARGIDRELADRLVGIIERSSERGPHALTNADADAMLRTDPGRIKAA
jgi:hypothetical protein